jgi:hypothetical protein
MRITPSRRVEFLSMAAFPDYAPIAHNSLQCGGNHIAEARCGVYSIAPVQSRTPLHASVGNRRLEERSKAMRDLKWSSAEKAVARKAFDLALRREFDAVIQEAKSRASRIEKAAELWELEAYLARKRREIDSKYDYRYSVLPMVFGILIRAGWLSEDELRGLGEDKMRYILGVATLG